MNFKLDIFALIKQNSFKYFYINILQQKVLFNFIVKTSKSFELTIRIQTSHEITLFYLHLTFIS